MVIIIMKTKNNICSECKSTFTYIRISTKERVCRTCGHIEKYNTSSIAQNALDEKTKEVLIE